MPFTVFFICICYVTYHVCKHGDYRDILALGLIACQFGLEHVFLSNQFVSSLIFGVMVWCFVAFSIKPMGAALGVVSGILSIVAALSHFGYIPNEHGQGMAWNYHHMSTVLMYIQIGILWSMTNGNFNRNIFN